MSAILFSAIFYAKYTDLKNIVRCHSTGLVQSKLGTFSPDRRLSRPNPDPQGLPCLTCVQPNLTCPIHSPGIQSLDEYQNKNMLIWIYIGAHIKGCFPYSRVLLFLGLKETQMIIFFS